MAYQVTARKWRPQKFSDMVGQEHIARTLRNAISSGRIAHAYLFVGPRGIGKTTTARIFAKALNCEHPIDGEPCCQCASCRAIADESSVDVIEIDAATHTQVEKARDICEDVLHLPINSKYKIYIIDEVHMLSKSAWNALLKTIEEPPAHAKFIFATTEVNKVLPTVISRCQRFDLSRIPAELITKRLAYIAEQEKINISPSALNVIARAADGGMRDAQSLLDQLVSFFGTESGTEAISESQALSLFGLTAPEEMEGLLRNILLNDKSATILSVHQFASQSKNLETLFDEVLAWLRGILLTKILQDPNSVLDESPEKLVSYKKLAELTRPDTLQILMEQMAASTYMLREAINKQVFIETILLKAMRAAHAVRVEDLLIRLNQIRKNGELDGIENIPPAQFQEPVKTVYVQVPPPAPQAVEPIQQAVKVPPAPQPEPMQKPAQEISPAPIPVKETPVPQSVIPPTAETLPVQEEKSASVTENIIVAPVEKPQQEPEPASESANNEEEQLPEETETWTEENIQENEASDGMSLKERFSPSALWEKLAEMICGIHYTLGNMMQEGFPDKIERSVLYVSFDDKYGVQIKNSLDESLSLLKQSLRELTGDTHADLSFSLKKGLHAEEKPQKKMAELKEEAAKDPLVAQTRDLFAGVIVDVLE